MHVLFPIAALLASVAILLTGNGLQGILLPIRGELEGFSAVEVGLIASSYFTGFVAGCVVGPRVLGSVGHIRAFSAMTAIAAAAVLAHPFAPVAAFWWVLRAASGFCFAVLYMVIESWLNERSTQETRGAVMSAYMIINLTVLTAGQMLLPLYDPEGMELFALVAISISLAAVPVALTRSAAPSPVTSTKLRLRHLYDVSPTGVVGCLAVGLANSAFWALAPLFAQANGLDTTGVALFMSATVIGGALGQWPLGKWSDRVDRRKVILVAAALATAAGVLLVVRPLGDGRMLFAMAALWGSAAFPLYSLVVAHANDHASPDEFVEVSGGLLLVYGAGAITGPFIASLVTEAFGPRSLYAYPAAVYGLLIGYVVWRLTRLAPPPIEEHVDFADALSATQTVSQVFVEPMEPLVEVECLDSDAPPRE